MGKTADLLPGTLDMLILKAVSLEPLHGYGVLLRIRQISGEALEIPQGSLYPALYRLEHQGHRRGLGPEREQPPGKILYADCRRTPPPSRGDGRLEPAGFRHRRCFECHFRGGLRCFRAFVPCFGHSLRGVILKPP